MPVSPPELFSLEAERALLGCILIDPDALHEVADRVEAGYFHAASHRAVYRAMRALDAGDVALDLVALAEALARGDAPEPENGWHSFLIGLLNVVPTSMNVAGYARIVSDHAQRRGLIRAAEQLSKLAYDLELPGERALGQAAEAVLSLQSGHERGHVLSPREYVREFLDDLEGAAETEAVPTPIVGLNQILLGGLSSPFTSRPGCQAQSRQERPGPADSRPCRHPPEKARVHGYDGDEQPAVHPAHRVPTDGYPVCQTPCAQPVAGRTGARLRCSRPAGRGRAGA